MRQSRIMMANAGGSTSTKRLIIAGASKPHLGQPRVSHQHLSPSIVCSIWSATAEHEFVAAGSPSRRFGSVHEAMKIGISQSAAKEDKACVIDRRAAHSIRCATNAGGTTWTANPEVPGFDSRRLRFVRRRSSVVEREAFHQYLSSQRLRRELVIRRSSAHGYSMTEQTATQMSSSIVEETSPSLRTKRW